MPHLESALLAAGIFGGKQIFLATTEFFCKTSKPADVKSKDKEAVPQSKQLHLDDQWGTGCHAW